jgi:hypothetical protein
MFAACGVFECLFVVILLMARGPPGMSMACARFIWGGCVMNWMGECACVCVMSTGCVSFLSHGVCGCVMSSMGWPETWRMSVWLCGVQVVVMPVFGGRVCGSVVCVDVVLIWCVVRPTFGGLCVCVCAGCGSSAVAVAA